MPPGFVLHPGLLDRAAQEALVATLRPLVARAPLFAPVMPGTGKAFSVRMTNLGSLGWVSDRGGYRYQAAHPDTGAPWPAIPADLITLWDQLTGYHAPPEACLVNLYRDGARMGLHVDADEDDRAAPVVSISLGDEALFRIGGPRRGDPSRSVWLRSGDVVVLGGAARACFHGIDRVREGSSTLLEGGGRLNLTLRRVTLSDRTV